MRGPENRDKVSLFQQQTEKETERVWIKAEWYTERQQQMEKLRDREK